MKDVKTIVYDGDVHIFHFGIYDGVCAVLKQLFEPDMPPKRNKIGFDA